MPPSASSAIPVSAPPAATVPRDWVHGAAVDDPGGTDTAATNPVAFAFEPATSMVDPLRTAAKGVIVDEIRVLPPDELAEYVDTVMPDPPDTT